MSDLVYAGTPEWDRAIAAVDAHDAETRRLSVGIFRRLGLYLKGKLCWRCNSQKIAEGFNRWRLCERCQHALDMLENVQ